MEGSTTSGDMWGQSATLTVVNRKQENILHFSQIWKKSSSKIWMWSVQRHFLVSSWSSTTLPSALTTVLQNGSIKYFPAVVLHDTTDAATQKLPLFSSVVPKKRWTRWLLRWEVVLSSLAQTAARRGVKNYFQWSFHTSTKTVRSQPNWPPTQHAVSMQGKTFFIWSMRLSLPWMWGGITALLLCVITATPWQGKTRVWSLLSGKKCRRCTWLIPDAVILLRHRPWQIAYHCACHYVLYRPVAFSSLIFISFQHNIIFFQGKSTISSLLGAMTSRFWNQRLWLAKDGHMVQRVFHNGVCLCSVKTNATFRKMVCSKQSTIRSVPKSKKKRNQQLNINRGMKRVTTASTPSKVTESSRCKPRISSFCAINHVFPIFVP